MLKKYTLLRSQRNRVYEMLREEGLEASEFSWTKETIAGTLTVSQLNFRDGTYYFQFSSHEVNAWCAVCPGQFRSLDYEYPKTWEEQEGIFKKWVHWLKREVAAPDLWGELANYTLALGIRVADEGPNEPISAGEADRIAETMNRLAAAVGQEFKLEQGERAVVRSKLDYLAEAARRQRSRDWVYTAIGVCASLAMAIYLPKEQTGALWQVFQRELGWFIQLTGPESDSAAGAKEGRKAAVESPPENPVMEPHDIKNRRR